MRAIGYFREAPGPEGALAAQHRAFLDYCQRHGYDVAGTFVDSVSSNGTGSGFRKLISYLRHGTSGEQAVVVVPDVRTLGADLREAARRYFQLQCLGAKVTDVAGSADPAADLVRAWDAEDPSTRVSDRVRAAMRRKAVKGEVLGRPPYGYRVGARRRLEVVPEEAVVVRYIFRLYLQEGIGIRLIARRLNEEDIRTRRGGRWSMVTIRDILRNRVYLGTYSRFGVRVPGSHQSLISPDDFRMAQDRLNARRTSFAPREVSEFLLSGLARCGYCGNRLIGVTRRQAWKRKDGTNVSNVYRYYQCESRTNQSVCGYHTRRADALESEVRERLQAALASTDRRAAVDGDADASAGVRDAERLRAKLRALDRKLEGLIDAATKGRMSIDRMQQRSIMVAAERLAVEDALELSESRSSAGRTERDAATAALLAHWETLPFSERQARLRDAVDEIIVSDDSLSVRLRG